jgi:hypothetical protein
MNYLIVHGQWGDWVESAAAGVALKLPFGTTVLTSSFCGVIETELEMVQQHVRDGERHVANQREILAFLLRHSHRTELAEKLLVNLENLLQMRREHLARIRK